jgi:hypothetical protein
MGRQSEKWQMIPKHIDAIEAADLEWLRENQVAEGKTMEYKRELPGPGDQERVRFLRAVSSMANTSGGDVVFGVEEQNGIPTSFPGIEAPDPDALKQRLENSLRDSLQPRLREIQIKMIPVNGGRSVLVVRTPRSWNAPHRITLGNHGHFYGRNSAGAYQMDTDQLRSAFTASVDVEEKIARLREERIHLMRSRPPIPLNDGALLIAHVVPISAVTSANRIPAKAMAEANRLVWPNPRPVAARPTLEGFIRYTGAPRGVADSYALTMRNGVFEIVEILRIDEDGIGYIHANAMQATWAEALPVYIDELLNLGVSLPAYVFFTFLGVGDFRIWQDRRPNPDPNRPDGPDILLPEIVVEQVPFDAMQTITPAFDTLWNAFGHL